MGRKVKVGFKNLPTITHLGGKDFRLENSLHFYSGIYKREFIAPAGTITDFASIPQIAQSFVGVLGNNIRSAILHDFHCRPEGKKASGLSQKDADKLFQEGLAVDEVRWSKARVMFYGVTMFQRVKYIFKKEGYSES